MGKSKTFEILKQNGIWGALEHIIDKKAHKGGIYALLQRLMMAQILRKLDSAHSNEMILFCKKHHIYTTNPTFLKYFAKEYDNIKLWLASQSFLEKYANHPYPPLLNPDTLDYEQISPQIAWELNIPLPPYYQFLYFGSHATGNTGLENLIQRCGGLSYYQGDVDDRAKAAYITLFTLIMEHTDLQDYFSYIALRNYIPHNKKENGEKLCALIPNTPSIYLVRDPISALKSACSLTPCREVYVEMKKLVNPEDLLHFLQNRGKGDKEDLRIAETDTFAHLMEYFIKDIYYCFHDTQLWDFLINFKESIILDMAEIVGDRAFETIHTLTKQLHFPPPKPEDKEIFAMGISEYQTILPLTLEFKSHNQVIAITLMDRVFCMDKRKYIFDYNSQRCSSYHKQALEENANYKDITFSLFGQTCFYDRIILCIHSKDWAILFENENLLGLVKKRLLEIIPLLEKQKEMKNAKKLTEKDILEYLKSHKDLCLEAKVVFEKHLTFLASVRPDIIESWKYYQEFLAMCEEMS
ncbi:DUF2972 domain-containing protein [Helicobacter ganmani]|uniref:DUF2972 domain-containing protein n=1 Tax=Helicobacter ganmani TaxID=60246 RepID=UPI003A83F037